jgi:hypothetical protein
LFDRFQFGLRGGAESSRRQAGDHN